MKKVTHETVQQSQRPVNDRAHSALLKAGYWFVRNEANIDPEIEGALVSVYRTKAYKGDFVLSQSGGWVRIPMLARAVWESL